MQGLKKFRLIIVVCLSLLVGLSLPVLGRAATATNDIGYSVKALIPKNQIDKRQSFFELRMKPGQTQTLRVRLYNVTDQAIKIKSAIHTAWTNSGGTIDYTNQPQKFDSSLQYKMSDISKVQGAKTVTIPARKSRVMTTKVQVPRDQKFNGIILGGWYFERLNTKVTSNVKGASNVRNKYAYVVGMEYVMGKVPAGNLTLGKVGAGISNYHRGVIANLKNPTATIVPNLKMTTTITNRDGGQVIKDLKQENVQMAPNTTFSYPMLYGKTALDAGHYRLHMVVKNRDRTWVFDRNFAITKAQADKYNADSVDNPGINIWLLIGLGALGMLILILLILLIIYLIRRRRRDDEEAAE
ncbi:DUF916 and DUF3324 domain-containing protein [Levilactobacillus suantsaiihabitans]|uniref:DUF916 and DUF3324 domain-containing protein n=1 Tax=Levilactobacillus suantsaiihabitans TaxID=2487722 RepID=A0A4Z0JD43_9LACO|nr:DUF916 and DUF3324 domain-containing protein [Levilactobacillus suantsaiihabitans]TGD19734.1 DUF916 and DUF3324 domain-containing protein [Levilactobacillus suantsaiihabitans]